MPPGPSSLPPVAAHRDDRLEADDQPLAATEEAPMQPGSTPFVADEERSMVRDALIGIIVGILAFSLMSFAVVLLGWPEQSIGFAAVIAVFTGPWAGVFFGSAGGVAYAQWRERRAAAADTTTSAPTVPPVAPPSVALRH
jgi:hypothetical protein